MKTTPRAAKGRKRQLLQPAPKAPAPSFTLSSVFGDHMVIQRDKPVRVFGKAAPGSGISVRWKKSTASVKADASGAWQATFPAGKAGGPYTLTASDGRTEIALSDILVGDLWLCSGQSNMEMRVVSSKDAAEEIAAGDHAQIRQFRVERIPSPTVREATGQWTVCSPETVGEYTAVGYHFARHIHGKTRVPVGLLHSSFGGTPVEAWLPKEALARGRKYQSIVRYQETLETAPHKLEPEIRQRQRAWAKAYISKDPGNKGFKQGWAAPSLDDAGWPEMEVPGAWEGRGLMIDGAVWFRRTVKIPAAWAGKPLRLELGSLDDYDVTYYNGREIGRTGKSVKDAFKHPRDYTIPGSLVTAGAATIAIRIFDQYGSGGFTNVSGRQHLSCPGQKGSLSLTGPWRYQVEWAVNRTVPSPAMPELPQAKWRLSHLYNGMIHSLAGVPIKGFLWYQGESNASRACTYAGLFSLLIRSWRRAWRDDSLPFYYVQLANFKSVPPLPGEDPWSEIREAQTETLRLPHTGMAIAIDVGEAGDIHPKDKQSVGHRLALLALARTYGKKVADSGPFLKTCDMQSTRARVRFSEAGRGLKTQDGQSVRGFAMANRARQWAWAEARIEGEDTVIVKSPFPRGEAVAVRYGWASNPDCNLANSHGLPACPFRTDRWPRVTQGVEWPY